MSEATAPETEPRVSRIIELKLPLTWMLGVGGVVSWALISMYFSVGQLVKTVDDLQITVKSGNSSVTAIAGKQALTEFRLDNVEAAVKKNESAILVMQQQRGGK